MIQTQSGSSWAHDIFAKDGRTVIATILGVVTEGNILTVGRTLPSGEQVTLASIALLDGVQR